MDVNLENEVQNSFSNEDSENQSYSENEENSSNGNDIISETNEYNDEEEQGDSMGNSQTNSDEENNSSNASFSRELANDDEDNISLNSHLDFPEYANEKNKQLQALILEKRKAIKMINVKIDDCQERYKDLNEHLQHISVEVTKDRNSNKLKDSEIESETAYDKVLKRQCTKMKKDLSSKEFSLNELREKVNDAQRKVFDNNQKIEKARIEINWNREEIDQWITGVKQKEEDQMALEKYKRADDLKIKELNLSIEKHTLEKGDIEEAFKKEVTEAQALQIQINKISDEFNQISDERHEVYMQLEQVNMNIEIKEIGMLKVTTKMENINNKIKEANEKVKKYQRQMEQIKKENSKISDHISKVERTTFQKRLLYKEVTEKEFNMNADLKILKNKDIISLISFVPNFFDSY